MGEVPKTARAGSRPGNGKKESAISRVLSWTTIHLGQPSPAASSDLPGSPLRRAVRTSSPRTPLFGLAPGGVYPAAACCHPRGALLPHLFTLAGAKALRRYVFCGTFHGLASSRRYLAPCPMEPGLSSRALRLRRLSGRLLSFRTGDYTGNKRGRTAFLFRFDPLLFNRPDLPPRARPAFPTRRSSEKPGVA